MPAVNHMSGYTYLEHSKGRKENEADF